MGCVANRTVLAVGCDSENQDALVNRKALGQMGGGGDTDLEDFGPREDRTPATKVRSVFISTGHRSHPQLQSNDFLSITDSSSFSNLNHS